ncbi:MAG TPA: hypothetical protein VFN53_06415 [Acidobacteriaceae bacterium]|nr:hypothetical protein [Acidobacteriaceae bacterium]
MSEADNAAIVDIVLRVLGEEKYSLAMRNANTLAKRLGQTSKEAGHATVSSMQASSAALRALHGGFENNIRAGERFLSTLPGVGNALRAAFPLIGITAVGGAIFEAGKKLYDMGKKAEEAGGKIRNAFNKLHYSAQQSNDELVLSTDRIRDQIAVLNGKPHNGLKDALDEAKVSADKLYLSLEKDNNSIASLLEKNSVGIFGGFVGKKETGPAADLVKSTFANIATLQRQIVDAQHSGKPQGQIDATVKDLTAKIDAARAQGISDFTTLRSFNKGSGNDANRAILTGGINLLHDQQYAEQDRKENDAAKRDLKSEQDKKKAAEEARKAAAAQAKAAHALERASELFARTISHASIIHKLASKSASAAKKGSVQDDQEFLRESRIYPMWVQARNAQNEKSAQQSGYDAQDIAARYGRKLKAAQVDAAARSGMISPLQADKAYTQMDAQQFAGEMAGLTQQLADIADITNGMSPSARAAASAKVNNKMAKLSGQYSVVRFKDKNAEQQDSVWGQLKTATMQLAQQFSQLGSAIANATQASLGMANMSMASGMTGQGFHARSLGIGAAQQGIGNMLQYGEGMAIKGIANSHFLKGHNAIKGLLGMGKVKPSGTHSDPLYVSLVRNQNQPTNATLGVAQSALNTVAPGIGRSSTDSPGFLASVGKKIHAGMKLFDHLTGATITSSGGKPYSGWLTTAQSAVNTTSSTVSALLPMAKHMKGNASGGYVSGNVPIVVGEMGREIFTPGAGGGYVTPHHSVAGNGGGSVNITNHINAQGAVDPAATAVAVKNAIHASAVHSVRASIQQQHEAKMRSPKSGAA